MKKVPPSEVLGIKKDTREEKNSSPKVGEVVRSTGGVCRQRTVDNKKLTGIKKDTREFFYYLPLLVSSTWQPTFFDLAAYFFDLATNALHSSMVSV